MQLTSYNFSQSTLTKSLQKSKIHRPIERRGQFLRLILHLGKLWVMNSIKAKIKKQHNVILYFLSFLAWWLMLDSLLQVRYNDKRKILVDFSGFSHLFATRYLVIVVWLFCCPYLESVSRMEDYICMENNFLSLIKTRHSVRAYKSEPVPFEVLADGSASTFVEDGSCRKPCAASGRLHWVIQPRKPVNPQHANKTILFGFNVLLSGAIFLRRILCREEGKYADQQ